jgi:hypothetical protein
MYFRVNIDRVLEELSFLNHWRFLREEVSFSRELFDNCAESVNKLSEVLEENVINRIDMLTSAVRAKITYHRADSTANSTLAKTRVLLAHYARYTRTVTSTLFRTARSGLNLGSGW